MKTIMLHLHAQTSIHAGAGSDDSAVDLPVQREAHTGYPCVFGSSLKGALRSLGENTWEPGSTQVNCLFGKEAAGDHAGALLISDARLLLLPLRSLTGQFRWTTCPMILQRYQIDAERFGASFEAAIPDKISSGQVLTPNNDGALYIEEYCFTQAEGEISADLITGLAGAMQYTNATDLLREQLAILSNDDFAYLARYALPVNAHNVLNERKVADNLWYEETLPPDTVLYAGIAATDSRMKDESLGAADVMDTFCELFQEKPWLQVGGNETVGMGWCHVSIKEGSACSSKA